MFYSVEVVLQYLCNSSAGTFVTAVRKSSVAAFFPPSLLPKLSSWGGGGSWEKPLYDLMISK